jgi:hypothetical protein
MREAKEQSPNVSFAALACRRRASMSPRSNSASSPVNRQHIAATLFDNAASALSTSPRNTPPSEISYQSSPRGGYTASPIATSRMGTPPASPIATSRMGTPPTPRPRLIPPQIDTSAPTSAGPYPINSSPAGPYPVNSSPRHHWPEDEHAREEVEHSPCRQEESDQTFKQRVTDWMAQDLMNKVIQWKRTRRQQCRDTTIPSGQSPCGNSSAADSQFQEFVGVRFLQLV